MTSGAKCSQCGAILPANSRSGQCLSCLFHLALGVTPKRPDTFGEIETSGDRIGPYLLVDVLGEGGHGTVYLAEQEEPVRRSVALKLIKPGMDSNEVIARFEAERQALALMDHPNIARVLDAGKTPAGRPFFVMELVEGERITAYCNRRKLNVRQRLDLFAKVCDAVHHAHQKGIVHRDLKPGNVLVAEQSGEPVAKVIDFGIAKAIGGERLTEKTLFTGLGQFIGTPAYMSPEQAELGGIDVDTRSDIYSLGILLYELLTNTMPFDAKRLLQAGLDEVRRIIREEEPPTPSARLASLTPAEQTTVACLHHSEPNRHRHELRGDLDCIVMKALEKDRQRRYQGVNAFAVDLRRFLHDEPIEARPTSNLYRLRKAVQRNKLLFGAAAIVFLSLVAALVFSTWRFRKEKEARQRAALAEQEQSRLREIAELRAYSADMNLAGQSVQRLGSLNGLASLIDPWRNHVPDYRGWEWYYLNGFLHHAELTVQPDDKSLRAFSWSPDGKRFAVAGDSGIISIWDGKDGRKLSSLDAGAPVFCVAWHPLKEQLVSSTTYGTVAIWDVASGSAVRSWRPHLEQVRSVAWSSDGRKLATAGYSDQVIAVFDPETGTELWRGSTGDYVHTVAWSPDDSILASSGNNPQVELWDSSAGQQLKVLRPGGCAALAWSPDGRFLATGGYDSVIRIWEVQKSKLIAEYPGHGGFIAVLKWSPDGRQIMSTGRDDGAIKIWEPFAGKVQRHFRGHVNGAHALAWHPDGRRVASASLDGTARIWDTQTDDRSRRRIGNTNVSVLSLTWSPDGNYLLAGTGDGQIQLWSRDEKLLKTFPAASRVEAVAWTADPKRIAWGEADGTLQIRHLQDEASSVSVKVLKAGFRSLSWNQQGTMFAAGGSSPVKIWDAAAQNLIASVDVLYTPTYSVDWSPDGKFVAAAAGKTIRIIDVTAAQLKTAFHGHRDTIRCIAYSPDGNRLVSGGEDTVGSIWDAQTGAVLQKLPGHSGSIYSVAWSGDGKRIATGSWDASLKIWNPDTGQELCSISTSPMTINTIAWHPDGRQIVVGFINHGMAIFDSSPGLHDGKPPGPRPPLPEPLIFEEQFLPGTNGAGPAVGEQRDPLAELLVHVDELRRADPQSRLLTDALDRLCATSFERRQFAKTEAAARELAPLRRNHDGPKSASYMHAIHWLALSLMMQKSWAEAEPCYRECLAVADELPNDPMLAGGFKHVIRSEFAETLIHLAKHTEAESLLSVAFPELQGNREFSWAAKTTADRLVLLYTETGETNAVEHWKTTRYKLDAGR